MTDDREEDGEHDEQVELPGRIKGHEAGDDAREDDGDRPFARIGQEGDDERLPAVEPAHVRRADGARSARTRIGVVERLGDEHAERDTPHQEGHGCDKDEIE